MIALSLKQKLWPFFTTKNRPAYIWFALALAAVMAEMLRHDFNNYLIFKGVFTHTLEQVNLYSTYPAAYFDSNHYGPVFSLLIAPFALLPNNLGVVLWALANAWVLYVAVRMLPLTLLQQNAILLISVIELMTSLHSVQFNPSVTALLILAYVMVDREKDFWATLFIAIGFMVKLYGIGGLAFFCFSKHKMKFALSFLYWVAILFALPMLLSSPRFIVQSYQDWYHSLVAKNDQNNVVVATNMQDISVPGMLKRIFNIPSLSLLAVLAPAAAVFGLGLLRFKQYMSVQYRLTVLSSVLLMIVLFSSSSESPTYVIAVVGAAIWWAVQPNPTSKWNVFLLVFVLVLTSLSITDVIPHALKVKYVVRYSLKALPCFVVWLVASAQLLRRNFVISQSNIA